ncbi:hypothetical protein D3C73_1284600 [compost metagenome]
MVHGQVYGCLRVNDQCVRVSSGHAVDPGKERDQSVQNDFLHAKSDRRNRAGLHLAAYH